MPRVYGKDAILAVFDDDVLTWTNPVARQTPVIVTYSFSKGARLDKFGDFHPDSANYYKFTAAQRANFRDAADVISDSAGIVFVEVSGRGMLNIARGSGTDTGGFASYPVTGETFSDSFFSEFVVDGTGSFNEGSYEFLTMLHELGHAVGLSHPHEGRLKLVNSRDDLDHTVMTYNNDTGSNRFPVELGSLDHKALNYLYGDPINVKGWSFKQGAEAFKIAGSSRNDTIFGVADTNSINGRAGNDTLIGRDYDDDLFGGAGRDTLSGNFGEDILKGNGGKDSLFGGRSDDDLFGGDGHDTLEGGDGEDHLFGGANADRLSGDDKKDELYGGTGQDRLDGDNGDDKLFGGAHGDELYGGANADELKGGDGDDKLFGGTGDDVFYGGKGNDILRDFTQGTSGSDVMYGGDGDDIIRGASQDDTLYGGAGQDSLNGGEENDTLFGNAGDDTLIGGDGADRINGGAGNDEIWSGRGKNVVTGGLGEDTFVFERNGGDNEVTRITDFDSISDVIDLTDHNTSFAALVIQEAADGARVILPPGASIILLGYDTGDVVDGFFDF